MGILSVLKGLSVVFPVIVSTMGMLMASGVSYNMLVQKLCNPAGPPEDINKFICPDKSIMDHITSILSTKAGIQAIIAAFCGFTFGFIRDLTGKSKILMYVGVTGELVSACASFASAYYWNSSPWFLAIMQAIASGGFGENIMQMGAACILMAESTPEELPLRMQLYVVSTLTVAMFGGLLTTLVVTTFGYLWLFILCIGLNVLALILIVILVKNKGYDRKTFKESTDSLKKVFKWRENVTVLWFMLICLAVAPIIFTGEALHSGKFTQIKFHYSMYQGQVLGLFSFLIAIVGSVVGPTILRNVFHFKELSIGIVVCFVNSAAAFMHAFINTEVLLYLGGAAYFLKLAALPLPNSVITTIVGQDELGTYLGINAILTSCIPFGITKLYQEVSTRTLDTWVGAFYFVSSGCFVLLGILYSVSYCLYVEPKKQGNTESTENLRRNLETVKTISPEDNIEI
ncbi:unnamed protein product [Nezara viridula]|uniref:Uncharacterized protein n=1 Tax=Nezara viridula TaxID=85310 RepID=A0A9P0H231_NEZVI|nr:unnamed protein product [Nezara viridula]